MVHKVYRLAHCTAAGEDLLFKGIGHRVGGFTVIAAANPSELNLTAIANCARRPWLEYVYKSGQRYLAGQLMREETIPRDTGINRHGRIMIPKGDDMILIGDTVVVITAHKGLHDLTDILK